ncbi:MAG: hypothetical protein ACREQN_06655 [Candidatus Binataceae bacterium]
MPRLKDAKPQEVSKHDRNAKKIAHSLELAANKAKALHLHLTNLDQQARKMAGALGKTKAAKTGENSQHLHSLLQSTRTHVDLMASSGPLESKQMKEHRAEVKKTLPHLRAAERTARGLSEDLKKVLSHTSEI